MWQMCSKLHKRRFRKDNLKNLVNKKENKKLIKITISVDKQKSRCYLSICKVLALKNKEC